MAEATVRAHDRGLVAVLLCVLALVAAALVFDAREVAAGTPAGVVEIDLKQRLQDVELRRENAELIVVDAAGRSVRGDEWLEQLASAQETQRGAGVVCCCWCTLCGAKMSSESSVNPPESSSTLATSCSYAAVLYLRAEPPLRVR